MNLKKMNMEFFQRTLGKYHKSDPDSQLRIKASLTTILKEFEYAKHRLAYLQKLCQSSLKLFQELESFEDIVEALLEITEKESVDAQDKQKLQTIIRHLIVEFSQIGYSERYKKNTKTIILKNTILRTHHFLALNTSLLQRNTF